MPQLGETVTEGTITRWLKQVGDAVAEDEVLFEVSTDKVDSEVPSPVAGVLTEILVPEGETVDVGTRLAVISRRRRPPAAPPASHRGGRGPGAEAAARGARAGSRPARPAAATAAGRRRAAAEPPARRPPARPPQAGRGRGQRATAPARAAAPGKLLSPVVRRLIAEHGLDPTEIEGTGAGGRITRADVLALIDRQRVPTAGRAAAAAGGAPPAAPAPRPAPRRPGGRPRRQAPPPAVAAGRARHGRPLHQHPPAHGRAHGALQAHSAHTMVAIEVDYSAVEQVRRPRRTGSRSSEGFCLTYLPFISRAVIDAIEDWPNVNSSVGDDELIVHNYVNLGIAVDLNFEGLLVPVIHDADGKRLRALAREISGLAARARAKRLTMDDIIGRHVHHHQRRPVRHLHHRAR